MGWQAMVGAAAVFIFLFWRYDVARENEITNGIEAAAAKQQLQGLIDNIENAKKLNDGFNVERADHVTKLGRKTAEINKYREQAEALAEADPKTYGDNFDLRVKRIVCEFSSQGDYAAEQNCNIVAAEAQSARVNTITITPQIAETYKELCEDGQGDFCRWSLTGYTPQGGLNFLSDFQAVVAHSLEQTLTINHLYKVIENQNKDELKNNID